MLLRVSVVASLTDSLICVSEPLQRALMKLLVIEAIAGLHISM